MSYDIEIVNVESISYLWLYFHIYIIAKTTEINLVINSHRQEVASFIWMRMKAFAVCQRLKLISQSDPLMKWPHPGDFDFRFYVNVIVKRKIIFYALSYIM